ncbi:ABC transporter permease [Halotalea alkalilenta]|uniref:ABC transporter permease n=1 Tax=Halotalea alkalilenta TaxID=376489 RepID=UPI0007D0A1A5|nr:ABC transporter permease [Halotalea alkalilenta]
MSIKHLTAAELVAAAGLCLFLACTLLAPWLAPYPPDQVVGFSWAAPSQSAWLGTDNLGRDLLSRLIWGTRISLVVTLAAALIAFALGVLLGFIAGLRGGWIDQLICRCSDVVMSIPTLIWALIVLSLLPKTLPMIILVLGLIEANRVMRVARSLAMDISTQGFVEVARLRGERLRWILWREIFPNALTVLLAEFSMRFIFIMLFLSALSFLGLGIQPPTPDWGGLARENKDGIIFGIWAALLPGLALACLAVCINVIVDGILSRRSTPGARPRVPGLPAALPVSSAVDVQAAGAEGVGEKNG